MSAVTKGQWGWFNLFGSSFSLRLVFTANVNFGPINVFRVMNEFLSNYWLQFQVFSLSRPSERPSGHSAVHSRMSARHSFRRQPPAQRWRKLDFHQRRSTRLSSGTWCKQHKPMASICPDTSCWVSESLKRDQLSESTDFAVRASSPLWMELKTFFSELQRLQSQEE